MLQPTSICPSYITPGLTKAAQIWLDMPILGCVTDVTHKVRLQIVYS